MEIRLSRAEGRWQPANLSLMWQDNPLKKAFSKALLFQANSVATVWNMMTYCLKVDIQATQGRGCEGGSASSSKSFQNVTQMLIRDASVVTHLQDRDMQ